MYTWQRHGGRKSDSRQLPIIMSKCLAIVVGLLSLVQPARAFIGGATRLHRRDRLVTDDTTLRVNADSTIECPPVSTTVSKPHERAARRACDAETAILETHTFHDETIPAMVKLLVEAGAAHNLSVCVTVLDVFPGRRFDLFELMHQWDLPVRVLEGEAAAEEYLRTPPAPLLLAVNTMDSYSRAHSFTPRWLDLVIQANPAQSILAGCHNVHQCLPEIHLARQRGPQLNITPQVFHPAASLSMVRESRELPITAVPFYFGSRFASAQPHAHLTILIVGSLKKGRDLESVFDLSHVALNRSVRLVFFGHGLDTTQGAHMKHSLERTLGKQCESVTLASGNYSTFFMHAQDASFIAPLIDNSSERHEEYLSGKLTSSLAVASAFLVPVIGCGAILSEYGLRHQVTHQPSGRYQFAEAVARAVAVHEYDRAHYEAMRGAQCGYVTSHFETARTQLGQVLLAARQEQTARAGAADGSVSSTASRASVCTGLLVVTPYEINLSNYNVGDRATQVSAAQQLRSLQRSRGCESGATLTLIGIGSAPPIRIGNETIKYVMVARGVSGFAGGLSRWMKGGGLDGIHAIVVLGNDVLDGRYGMAGGKGREVALAALANQAAAAGISFTVATISYDRLEKSGLGDFPMSTCFRPRSDGSLRVIQQILGVRPTVAAPASCASLPPAVARTADSVYLLQPNDAPAPWVHETLRWINEQRGASRTVVGVNLLLYADSMPAVPDTSVKILDAVARELCAAATRHRLAFILTPHDFRIYKSGPANLRAVKEKLAGCAGGGPPTQMMHSGLAFEPHDELLVVKHLDLVVSGSMHFLVISSNAGTPGVAIHGQAKHTQLIADLYGDEAARKALPPLEIQPAQVLASIGSFASFLVDAVRAAPRLRELLVSSVPKMRALSLRNFEAVFAGGCCSRKGHWATRVVEAPH